MRFTALIYKSFGWRMGNYISLFVLMVMLSRYFGSADSGGFNYFISIAALLVLVAGLGIDSSLTYFISKGECSGAVAAWLSAAWSLFAAIIASFLFIPLLGNNFFEFSLAGSFSTAALFLLALILQGMMQASFYGKGNYLVPGIAGILANLLLITVLLSNTATHSITITGFLKWYVIVNLVQAIGMWLLWQFLHGGEKSPPYSHTLLKAFFRYAVVVLMSNLVFFLVYRVDYWFVKHYCSPSLLGNYIQVSKLVQVFLLVPASMASVIFPGAAGGHPGITGRLKTVSRLYFICTLLTLGLLAAAGKWLFVWIFGPSFSEMYIPFLLIMPGILALSQIASLGAYFSGRGLSHINLRGGLVALLLMISGDCILVPLWQINGAALVCSLSYATFLGYLLYRFYKLENEGDGAGFFIPTANDIRNLRKGKISED